jgi:FdhD protein
MAHPTRTTARVPVTRYRAGVGERTRDVVSLEEPLEIRVRPHGAEAATPVAVTMRTPGHDFELVAGFLVTEGIVDGWADLSELSYCRSGAGPQLYNIVEARLRPGVTVDLARLSRNVFTSSSCGVCGKGSLEALDMSGCRPLPTEGTIRLSPEILAALPAALQGGQRDFERTGGIHAAALADAEGRVDAVYEDVGRHNAVDKVLGEAFLARRLPRPDRVLVVSGRTSFEILQKAVAAGVPAVVAVGAPTSLAIDLAQRFNLTLVGFTRGGGFNLYAGAERVVDPSAADPSAVGA